MIQNRPDAERRPQAGEQTRRDRLSDSAFKPVALPALAAAVQAVRPRPASQAARPSQRQVPAILRKDHDFS
jgi:hypothetical protein